MKRGARIQSLSSPAPGRLARLEWQLLLTALAAVVLFYPLRLDPALLAKLNAAWNPARGGWGAWASAQLLPFLDFSYSPLAIKATLGGYVLLGFIAVSCMRALLTPLTVDLAPAQPFFGGPRWWFSVLAFFAWCCASGFWSVTPLTSHAGVPIVAIFGVAFWLMLRRGFTLRELRTVAWLFVLLGVAALAFLAAQRTPWLLGRIAPSPFTEVRNRMGTLLGHNTAAAAFMLTSALMALALLLTTTRRWVRTGLLLYLAATVIAVLMMQSRAVWVLAPVMGLAALRHGMRHAGWKGSTRLPTLILLFITVALTSQAIDRPWNPFFVKDNPLARRLHAITPQALAEESRLRLNVVGLRLIPAAPLIGNGLNAFQYVYAAKQGEYFREHPATSLNRTLFYSDKAHNEYLQIWIEQGTVGLGLCMWALASLVRAGLRRRRELAFSPPEEILHAAFGWAALAFLIHAGFDFPFRVTAIALSGVFCLVGWAAPHRGALAAAANGKAAVESGVRLSGELRPQMVLRLTGALIALGAIPFVAAPLTNMLHGDVLHNQASSYLTSVTQYGPRLSPQQSSELLEGARSKFLLGLQFDPSDAMAQYLLAQCYTMKASRTYGRVAAASLPARERQNAAADILRFDQLALQYLDRAGHELDYYLIYFMRAGIYEQLARLAETLPGSTPQDADGYYTECRRQLERCLAYMPNFAEALLKLAEMLERSGGSPERIAQLRHQLYTVNPKLFESQFVNPAHAWVGQRRLRLAAARWDQVIAAAPDNGAWAVSAAQTHALLGHAARARAILAAGRQADPTGFSAAGGDVMAAGMGGDWIGVLLGLNSVRGASPTQNQGLRALEVYADLQLGRVGYSTRYPMPLGYDPAAWQREIADELPLWMMYFQNWPEARRAYTARLALAPPPHPLFRALGLYIARGQRDAPFEQQVLADLRQQAPQLDLLREWTPAAVPAAAQAGAAAR